MNCNIMKFEDVSKINFKRNPYRGILTEIAEEQNCTRQNIYQGVKNYNPQILAILATKLSNRNNDLKRLIKEIKSC